MQSYRFKMQWVLSQSQAIKLVELLGAKSFDFISALNLDLKRTEKYDRMCQYPYWLADVEAVNWIKNSNAVLYEFVRS